MRRTLIFALAAACGLSAEPAAEVLQRSQQFERAGETIRARAVLARAAGEAESDVETQLAYAEFLDRYRDPARRGAYEKALTELGAASNDQRRALLRRLVILSLIEGDSEAAKKYVAEYRAAGGPEMQQLELSLERTGDAGGLPMGSAQIPGLLEGFRRMAALSSDQRLDELMPALARNVMTSGYRTGRGAEALQQTEYLKLVLQYLSQARELRDFAGPNESIDVPACESRETAQLLKILGYRLRNDCGPSAVLETVNPSRAFLSIDSAFPLADLEEAYRRERAFQLPYPSTTLPVIFGPEYWSAGAKKRDKGCRFHRCLSRGPGAGAAVRGDGELARAHGYFAARAGFDRAAQELGPCAGLFRRYVRGGKRPCHGARRSRGRRGMGRPDRSFGPPTRWRSS